MKFILRNRYNIFELFGIAFMVSAYHQLTFGAYILGIVLFLAISLALRTIFKEPIQ